LISSAARRISSRLASSFWRADGGIVATRRSSSAASWARAAAYSPFSENDGPKATGIAAGARQPGDPLLQELLLSTYQQELGVLASVNQLTGTSAAEEAHQENVKL
jgi:hypothetical protein